MTEIERTPQTDRFDEFLDEVTEPMVIFGMTYTVSDVLRNVDPIAYRECFLDWLDANDEEEEE